MAFRSPEDGATFAATEAVVFEVDVHDPDDLVDDLTLEWIDASGTPLHLSTTLDNAGTVVDTARFGPGAHEISAQVADSAGNLGIATVAFTVEGSLPPP